MRAKPKTAREQRNEAAKALNWMAAMSGKGPTFELEPEPVRNPRKPSTPRTAASESEVLHAVIAFLNRHPAVAWAHRMNTGNFTIPGQNGQRDRYFRAGWVGAPDIVGQMRDGRFLGVEVKAERGGRVSEAQQMMIDKIRAANGVAGVVRSVDECALLVKYAHNTSHDGRQKVSENE